MKAESKASTPRDARPMVILVSSGYHLYREYLLDLVAEAGRVWLFLASEPTWEKKYIDGYTVVDTLDAPAMIRAARELPDAASVRGVFSWDEVRMIPCAELARALGLPGGDPEAIGRCRDKHRTRAALDAAHVPQAASTLVASLDAARAAAARIRYPVVVKPRALGASFGVSRADSALQIDEAYRNAREATEDGVPYYEEGVLVEECLDGPEISVDAACADGRLLPMFVARKVTGFPPHFEEVGHVVDARDPLLDDPSLIDVLTRAHRAVGFRDGITHTELRLTAAGPKVIEINCRLGGDFIPYVGYIASGIDPGRVAVQVACGIQPDTTRTRERVAAVHFFYPSHDCTVTAVDLDAAAIPPSAVSVSALASPGQALVLPPGGHVTSRYGYAIVLGETKGACDAALAAAAGAMTLRTSDGGIEPARVWRDPAPSAASASKPRPGAPSAHALE